MDCPGCYEEMIFESVIEDGEDIYYNFSCEECSIQVTKTVKSD